MNSVGHMMFPKVYFIIIFPEEMNCILKGLRNVIPSLQNFWKIQERYQI